MKISSYRGGCAVVIVGATTLLLSGCGSEFPTLTQEEYDMIVDYSAGVLSKYNMYNGDKLTKVTALEDEGEEESPTDQVDAVAGAVENLTEEVSEEYGDSDDDSSQSQVSQFDAEIMTEDDYSDITGYESDDEIHETEVYVKDELQVDISDDEADAGIRAEVSDSDGVSSVTDSGNAVDIGEDDLLQKIQSGIGVSLNGYYVLNSYPDNMTGGGMVLTADPGNKLLILSFSLTNRNSSTVMVDFLSANPTFWLMINGEHVSKNLVTLLDNDLSTYYSEIGGGDTAGAVLCFDVSDELAKKIDSISLKMSYHGEEQLLRIE